MYSYWPHQKDNPIADVLNNSQKFVVSTTLEDPLPWMNSTLLRDDAAVTAVKEREEKDIVVLGSGELLQSLMARALIDEYLLMIHPVVLGQGAADVSRRRPAVHARARGQRDHHDGRRHGDVPAGMTRYLLSVIQPEGDPPPSLDLDRIRRDVIALQDEMKAAGAWVFSAACTRRAPRPSCASAPARS
jgi:hypothetical protein